jgi:hypothetical protein
MKIVVSGASGFIGSALVPFLTSQGYQVARLVRSKVQPGGKDIHWDPSAGFIDVPALEGCEAAVHLAGENIAEGRWSSEKKARIRNSRVEGTHLLAEALSELKSKPKVLVCASAVGFYGNRGAEIVREDSSPGSGFLAEVCQEWEAAAKPAKAKGIRVVHLRTGIVLSANGGALGKMLLPFKMGVGGVIGSGEQYWSWISIDDMLGVVHLALTNPQLNGPVNAVSPNPATNREFTKTLGRVLSRPTIFPMPAFVARAVFGEMGEEMLLASTRAEPSRLVAAGYRFKHPELESALRKEVKSKK